MSASKTSADKAAQDVVEGRTPDQSGRPPEPEGKAPPAGPHADPALVNPDATPGSGYLPEPSADDDADTPGGAERV